jgi:hypothetical protein
MSQEQTTFKSRVKSFFLKVLVVLILLGAFVLWTCSWTYSEGTRAGQLIKFSEKGVVFKTYEGELNMGGLRTGNSEDGLEGNLWKFSVLDENVVEELMKAEGKRVKLGYKERYKAMVWQGDTNYFIVKVEVIDE